MKFSSFKFIADDNTPVRFGFIFDTKKSDIAAFEDAIEDATSLKNIADRLNKLNSFGKFTLDRLSFSENKVRYKFIDTMSQFKGDVSYLYLYGVE